MQILQLVLEADMLIIPIVQNPNIWLFFQHNVKIDIWIYSMMILLSLTLSLFGYDLEFHPCRVSISTIEASQKINEMFKHLENEMNQNVKQGK